LLEEMSQVATQVHKLRMETRGIRDSIHIGVEFLESIAGSMATLGTEFRMAVEAITVLQEVLDG